MPLHCTHLNLAQNSMGASGARALAGLKNAAALHTLTILREHGEQWCASPCGTEECRCTAHPDLESHQRCVGLKNAAALQGTNLGTSGVQALAGLKDARLAHCEQKNSFVLRAAGCATHLEPCFE